MNEELKGLIVPVLTPFEESGAIDPNAFIRHLEFLSQNGVRRIMVNGTTAAFYSLLPEERKQLLELARRHFPGLIVLHAAGAGLAQARIEVQWANEFADAVAVLPPLHPVEEAEWGIIHYLQKLGKEAEVPFLLYNFPEYTGTVLTPKILKEVPHFAIKDSAKNFELMEHTPRYLVGSSSCIYTPVQRGAAGFVSASGNVRPELYAAMDMLVVAAKVEEAAVMQQEIQAYSAQFSAGGVPLLKQALSRKLAGYPTYNRSSK